MRHDVLCNSVVALGECVLQFVVETQRPLRAFVEIRFARFSIDLPARLSCASRSKPHSPRRDEFLLLLGDGAREALRPRVRAAPISAGARLRECAIDVCFADAMSTAAMRAPAKTACSRTTSLRAIDAASAQALRARRRAASRSVCNCAMSSAIRAASGGTWKPSTPSRMRSAERAEFRRDHRNAERGEFRQRIAERFAEIRNDQGRVRRHAREQLRQVGVLVVEQDVHAGFAEEFFAFAAGAEQENLRVIAKAWQQVRAASRRTCRRARGRARPDATSRGAAAAQAEKRHRSAAARCRAESRSAATMRGAAAIARACSMRRGSARSVSRLRRSARRRSVRAARANARRRVRRIRNRCRRISDPASKARRRT